MSADMRRAVWLLGLCQCILWGVLYYSFSVFLIPMEHDLRLSRTGVAGAFSLGLFAMASSAPSIGRWLDRGYATSLIRSGVLLAVAGLVVISQAHDGFVLYAGWLLLGMAMATLLYESAFVLILRAITDPLHRLRALAAVTVMGGLASTIFLPSLSWSIGRIGWQTTTLGCTIAVLLVAWLMERFVLPHLKSVTSSTASLPRDREGPWPAHLATLLVMFGLATSASMVLTTLLIPLLQDRGATPAIAALVLGSLGVAQLPGRIWLLRGGRQPQGHVLTVAPMVLQAIGLLAVASASSLPLITFGVAVFGLGAGLQTLARPWLVQTLYGVNESGRWNGEVARLQGYARAIGPITAAATAWWASTPIVLASMSGLLVLTIPWVRRLPVPGHA